MITVQFHPNFIPERNYLISTVLGDFLGLDFKTETLEMVKPQWRFILQSGNQLIINDDFFAGIKEETAWYLKVQAPKQVQRHSYSDCTEGEQLILFGNSNYRVNEVGDKKTIEIGNDILAAAFFMLSRWEEACRPELKDEHGRFPESELLAVKENFIRRPIVNEHLELLWELLKKLGLQQKRKQFSYTLTPSHDVDYFSKYQSFTQFLKILGADAIKYFDLKSFSNDLINWTLTQFGSPKDPFWSFDLLMDISEKFGLKSEFFFMAGLRGEPDINYQIDDERVENFLKKIKTRGHRIGLHGSYKSFEHPELVSKEYKRIQAFLSKPLNIRQHYLRARVPDTFKTMAEAKFKIDSSVGFSSNIGFRSGICYPYKIWDLSNRVTLPLSEHPIIAMDMALLKLNPTPSEYLNQLINLSMIVKRYGGNFVFLWHNSNFGLPEWKDFAAIYPLIIKSLV